MKFDIIFSYVEPHKTPAHYLNEEEYHKLPEGNNKYRIAHILRMDITSKCDICGTKTSWVEINFEGYCCSEECDEKMWNEYEEACRKSNELHNQNISPEKNEDF